MRILLTSIMATNLLISQAFAMPPSTSVDPETSQWYRGLKVPNTNMSCCNIADCRPTDLRANLQDPRKWQAFISKDIFGPDAPNEWIDIPPEKILTQHDNPVGRVVICWVNGQIYCAVLPSLT